MAKTFGCQTSSMSFTYLGLSPLEPQNQDWRNLRAWSPELKEE
jgi:hypothetical protein